MLPSIDYGDLTAALTSNAVAVNLQPLPSFIEKAIQLYEMIVVRHGLMLVGRSFSMKTVAIKTQAAALGDLCAACECGGAYSSGSWPSLASYPKYPTTSSSSDYNRNTL